MKALIVEDEENTREALKKMLHLTMPSIQVIGETTYVSEAIELIREQKPDFIFLDIELEDGTGFDLLEKIDTIDFKIIFTTAYNNYAIKAFKFSAIDYLLKPIDPSELKLALEKITAIINNKNEHRKLIETLKNNLQNKEKKIVLKTSEQTYIIIIKDIIRLEADGAYTNFITTSQKIIVSKNIKYYQSLLDETFIRCHQSHLVNIKHIIGIDKNDFLQLSNNDLVAISTRKKPEIIQLIKAL